MVGAGLREPTFLPNAIFRAIFHRSPEFAMKKNEGESPSKLVEGLAEKLVEGLVENQKKNSDTDSPQPSCIEKGNGSIAGHKRHCHRQELEDVEEERPSPPCWA